MRFFKKRFPENHMVLYPLGDFHYGSRQCDEKFIRQVVDEIKNMENAYWVSMGDLIENALVGSKSDVYTQTVPPTEQMEYVVNLLKPIAHKGLFGVAGNHEQRSMRLAGLIPEQYMMARLGLPYMGFSCLAYFIMSQCKSPKAFQVYFHHNYGGGYTVGGKVNKAEALRRIVPTADAIFSAHSHITDRMLTTWFECGRDQIIEHVGYNYIIGSTLRWDKSYAEEKAKPAAACELIKVTFVGSNNGRATDSRKQIYEIIRPGETQ